MADFLGDNPVIKVNGLSLEQMVKVFELSNGFPAHGFVVEGTKLVLMKYPNAPKATPFPVALDAAECAAMVFKWVQDQTYGREPDHDGDNSKGWYVYNDDWGGVEGFGYHSFLAIEPMWIMYGK